MNLEVLKKNNYRADLNWTVAVSDIEKFQAFEQALRDVFGNVTNLLNTLIEYRARLIHMTGMNAVIVARAA